MRKEGWGEMRLSEVRRREEGMEGKREELRWGKAERRERKGGKEGGREGRDIKVR